jgi:hypothetical protein
MRLVSPSSQPQFSMVVDFYPVKHYDGSIYKGKFLKVLTFDGCTQSKKVVNQRDMEREVGERLALNYTVECYNLDAQIVSICAN